MKFRLRKYEKGEWKNAVEKGVFFTVEPGEVSPTYERTNSEGIVTTTFTQDSPDFDFATLEATYRIKEPDDTYEGGTSELIFKEKPGGGGGEDIKDEDLKKADKLKDDTYVVDDKVVSLDGADDEVIETVIENNLGEKITLFDWFKEDPVYYTIAWGGIYGFTDDMLGKEIDYLKEKANGNENLKLSFGAFIDPAGGYSETNVIEFNQENLEKAVFKMTRNADGTLSTIAYCKRKDGKVGMFKAKTKPKSN